MENDVPTLAETTPDSEQNNNSSSKASPGPATVISEPVREENDGQSDGAKTPLSTGNDVNNESPDGDLTAETKLPENGTTPSETPDNKGEETQRDPDNDTGQGGKDDHGKDSGLGGSVGTAEKSKEIGDAGTELQDEEVESQTKDDKAALPEVPAELTDEHKTDDTAGTTRNGVSEIVAEVNENSVKDTGTVENGDSGKQSEERQGGESSTSLGAEEGLKDVVESKTIEVPTAEECSTAEKVDSDQAVPSGKGDEKTPDETYKPETIMEGHDTKVDETSEEPQLSYEDMLTKYHATELQLDGMRDENAKLTTRIEELEKEVKQLREGTEGSVNEKQRDGYLVHSDYLARELSQTQDAEQFLKEKVAELLEEKGEGEKKIKDLQLRLKRFAKDDRAKDERIASLEAELKEISGVVEELETYVDAETRSRIEERRSGTRQDRPTMSAPTNTNHTKETNTNRSYRDPEPVVRSRTCVMF